MLAVGLMSGTSGDGVSVALADFRGRGFRLAGYQTFLYPLLLSKKVGLTRSQGALTLAEISRLHRDLGEFFASSTVRFLKKLEIPFKKIAVIGTHGHTLFHGPAGARSTTLQIGEPSFLSERTGIPVVSDFRQRDIAAGGEGAPLIPFFDHIFFGQGRVTACQNIGGIANVTLVGRRLKRPVAFDTGPGNCLIDEAVGRNGRLRFDEGGRIAARGHIHFDLVKNWLRHPYFAKRPPKSTGRELFRLERLRLTCASGDTILNSASGDTILNSAGASGDTILNSAKKRKLSMVSPEQEDLVATLTYFTAFSIVESYRKFFPFPPERVMVSGGGAKNQTLMNHLRTLLAPVAVASIESLGIPAQAKEPIAFAYYALRAISGRLNHLGEVTGAKGPRILGKITY